MAIPLGVCQRLFTKAFRGGSRTYSTQVSPDPTESWPYKIGTGLVYAGWLSFVSDKARAAGARSAAKKSAQERSFECTPLVEHIKSKKVDGHSTEGEIFIVHGANGETLMAKVLGTRP